MKNEAAIQQEIRLMSATKGTSLLRNNNGACFDNTNRLIRYGLGHDSEKLNKVFKSSDLIGINPVTITPQMIGRVIGQFMAIEVKREGWKPPGRGSKAYARYEAQANFGQWVSDHGGIFRFAQNTKDVWND